MKYVEREEGRRWINENKSWSEERELKVLGSIELMLLEARFMANNKKGNGKMMRNRRMNSNKILAVNLNCQRDHR